MSRVRVKICGLTSPEDARACHEAGADFLGVIFAESPRRITLARARAIRTAVPAAQLVGVFMNHAADEVAGIASHVPLDLLQLHGDESEELCTELRTRAARPVIKVVRGDSEVKEHASADFLLLDLEKGCTDPGSARVELWKRAASLGAAAGKVFLAGLLDQDNVGQAIAQAKPYAVDVCRGVEEAPGVKNLTAVHGFLAEVRRCNAVNG